MPAIEDSAKKRNGKIVHNDSRTKSSLSPNLVTRLSPTLRGFFFLTTAIKMPLIIINRKKSIKKLNICALRLNSSNAK